MGVEIERGRVRGGMDGERRFNRGERGAKGQQRVGNSDSRIIGGQEGEGVREGCEWRQTDSTNIGRYVMQLRCLNRKLLANSPLLSASIRNTAEHWSSYLPCPGHPSLH